MNEIDIASGGGTRVVVAPADPEGETRQRRRGDGSSSPNGDGGPPQDSDERK